MYISSDMLLQIGTLLQQFDLISSSQLQQALFVSNQCGLPIGKTMIALGYISQTVFSAGIEAQSLLRDTLVSFEEVKLAMRKVQSENKFLSDALKDIGVPVMNYRRNRLGELLAEAGLIKSEQLEFALAVAASSGMPLGQVLVLLNRISESTLRLTLALQREIRAGSISREKAIARLKRDSAGGETLDEVTLKRPGKVKLGKLIYLGGLITHDMLMTALRGSRASRRLLGQYLLENKLLSHEQLNLALSLQRLVWEGRITIGAASQLLQKACGTHAENPDQIPREIPLDNEHGISFFDFLVMSGYLSEDKISALVETISVDPKLITLVSRRTAFKWTDSQVPPDKRLRFVLKDPAVLRLALNKAFPSDQQIVNSALILFALSAKQGISVSQALVNLGIEWGCKKCS